MSVVGRIEGIAVRTQKRGLMKTVESAVAHVEGGLDGDVETSTDRGVTLLSQQQWHQVNQELGVDLPWYTRRANLLISGLDLAGLIGTEVTLGAVRVLVLGETKPCELMDEQYPGLLEALTPDCRAGVHARILKGGKIKVGDSVTTNVVQQ